MAAQRSPMVDEEDLRRLTVLLDSAKSALGTAGGAVAVCNFTRAGVAVPGFKYREGRWAALSEVARRCRTSDSQLVVVAELVRADWSDDLERLTSRRAGPDWIAYRSGGLAALAELAADLSPEA